MEYLAQNNQIVMLCPLVSQVEQLQQIYGHDDRYVFIHGHKLSQRMKYLLSSENIW